MIDLHPKYIIIDETYADCFSTVINHKDVEIKPSYTTKGIITGAGFFKIVDGRVCVFGYSKSLNMESKPSDADIIEQTLRLGEYAK